MPKALLPLAAVALLSGCIIVVDDDGRPAEDLQYELRTLSLDAADVERLVASTGAGSFELVGEAGRSSIELSAEVHFHEADDIRLSLERQGARARLVADMRHDSRHGGWAHIDVVLKVPAGLELDLTDGSGHIDIRGLRSTVLVEDGSGELRIDGGAAVTLTDGSGPVVVEHITGDVFIEDGSGDIEVREVGGTVTIDDGSGSISVRGAGGLNILESGSGGLDIDAIDGPVTL